VAIFSITVKASMATDASKHARSVISNSIIAPQTFTNATYIDPEVWLNYFFEICGIKEAKFKLKVNFEIYIADWKATTCI